MVQIKVTPEQLEQVAKTVRESRNYLEQIHNDLYNQTEYIASMWSGATSQRFYQMFNETKPQMFNVFREFDKIAEELMHAAEKFRNADERYDGNLVDGNLSDEKVEEGAMCGKPSEKSMLRKIWDGIYVGSGQVIGGIVEGFDSLDDTVTKENIKYAIGHPIETTFTAWNAVSDSFMNDFWHGDAESRTKWGTSVFMGLGLGWLGDKGISKVSTVARGAKFAKVTEITAPRLQPAFAGGLTSGTMTSMLPPTGNWGNYLSGYLMFARPSWRQSELDALKDNPNYREQVIFKDGLELEKKTKGSSIPDLYSDTVKNAIEVKNYDVSTSAKRTRLAYVIGKQVETRLKNLPEGTTQSIIVDIRGQEISATEILELKKKILDKTNDQVTIEIKKQ
ncbi:MULTISPECIES: WXG100 family type VII secretion target [unclassified Bacillus cereus group]|uniref:WXG100 family type VII secretion target n=1 Tax=unclassified Bacillus cereus group TaxID=2750818 RepID=UPI0024CD2691|nr:MAG: WXG100 family type VII secretion target [Bacillus paranthracis]WAI32097.1 MAG: WXG100 family type VII secretion target [Bacillus paranthracis]WAI39754.1 MAG: WXG100 family type VII secretion target [Bacillus paranthracis]